MAALPKALSPRKSPIQKRSRATVDAIHIATIQVLKREGLARCTTTRVAARAGVSVGTLYQYYADRRALLASALSRHLSRVAEAVEARCEALRGAPLDEMAHGLVDAFLAAKFDDPDETRALYAVANDHGGTVLISRMSARLDKAIARMLISAPDGRLRNIDTVSMMVRIAVSAPARAVFTNEASDRLERHLAQHCAQLVIGYLEPYRRR